MFRAFEGSRGWWSNQPRGQQLGQPGRRSPSGKLSGLCLMMSDRRFDQLVVCYLLICVLIQFCFVSFCNIVVYIAGLFCTGQFHCVFVLFCVLCCVGLYCSVILVSFVLVCVVLFAVGVCRVMLWSYDRKGLTLRMHGRRHVEYA